MPVPSPFHSRTAKLCSSLNWKAWGGYFAVRSFDTCHEPEYFAFRHQAGMIDVTPLFKYDIKGKDAARFLDRIMAKPVSGLKQGRVTYLCWCDDDGKVVDDGTVTRLGEDEFRVTAAEPSLSWLQRFSRGYQVEVEDISRKVAALAVQGPKSRDVLSQCVDYDMASLKFFSSVQTRLDGVAVTVSRTGYTGDLGYEIWMDTDDAGKVYDRLLAAGQGFGILPCGLDALDMTRVEAGFIMNGVDYFSAHHCLTDGRKNSPFELGLDWTVKLDRDPFIGQDALRKAQTEGVERKFVGLDIDWSDIEEICARYGLPPQVAGGAWRDERPVYDQTGEWIGQATSGTWSPILKKNLVLAQVYEPFAKLGTELRMEYSVEYRRHMVRAYVVKTPFFDPERKRS